MMGDAMLSRKPRCRELLELCGSSIFNMVAWTGIEMQRAKGDRDEGLGFGTRSAQQKEARRSGGDVQEK